MGHAELGAVCERAARDANRHGQNLEIAEVFISRAWHCGLGPGTFGIECVAIGGHALDYINTGDSYEATVATEGAECFVTSWGDWYEEAERKHCEKTGTIRCGYCGHYTPNNREDWRTIVCDSCSNLVSG